MNNKKMADYIILGVSMGWSNKKGLDVFFRLRNMLSRKYQILLVGIDEELEKNLPKGIVGIREISDQVELAKIYSACDVFLNPTREDTYPTVNLEAVACGLPVVTFHTGGSTEIVGSDNGIVVEDGDWSGLVSAIEEVCHFRDKYQAAVLRSRLKFDAHSCFKKYMEVYKRLPEGGYDGR